MSLPESLNLDQMGNNVFRQPQSGTYSQLQQHMEPKGEDITKMARNEL